MSYFSVSGHNNVVHLHIIFKEKESEEIMNANIEQLTVTNPNPVLSVEKNGTVLYSNEAGEPLLHELVVRVGEKLPSNIIDIVRRVLSQNSPEKMEVKVGQRIYLLIFHPSSEYECVNIYGFDTSEQKELEEKLQESERRLSEAQRMTLIGNYDYDVVSKKLYWSDELYRIIGLEPQEGMAYDKFLRYVHPDYRNYVRDSTAEALKGNIYAINYKIVRPDGKERIVHSEREVIFDETNNPARIKGTIQDITEHKKSEEEIQHLANIVESSNDAIGTVSHDGNITSWNKGAEQIYGFSAEEILGKPVSLLAPPHLSEETGKFSELIKQSGMPYQYVTLRVRKDGTLINVAITLSPVYNLYGKLTAISFISRDITKVKIAEEKLRESEEKYRNIVETANEGILIVDDKTMITYANKKMTDMLGYTLEEGIGKPIWSFISEEYKPIVELNLKQGGQGISESYELKLMRKDGSPLWTLVNAKSLFDQEDKFMGAVSMLTDVTKRKEAEEALTNIEIARKREIHHRIKNNLQVISSLLDLQAEKFRSKENIKDSEVLQAFRESQDRVFSMALIHEELHKGGDTDIIDLPAYIEELADNLFLTYRLGNNEIKMDIELAENIFFEMDTAVPLGIIINELISNSLKYAFVDRDKGEIRIQLHREGNGECKSEDCNTSYVLSVSDNGVGISKNVDIEDLDSLGLQLVTSLVEQLDGELELKRDNGTEFTIRFTVTENNNMV